MARVLVGMSGGVDSSVAALLMQRAGHEVVGLTALLFGDTSAAGPCCGKEGASSAKCVCDMLGIEHHWLDMTELFEKRVIGRFLSEYSAGRTPNPCSDCNRFIKFDAFFDHADRLGCELVATGHYARLVGCTLACTSPGDQVQASLHPTLQRATDANKDQSYFLACIPAEKLARIRFPLGEYTKPQVRELARAAGLPTADRKESMDICFMANRTGMAELLNWHTGQTPQPGAVVDLSGRELGRHHGIQHYTVGQRRGLGLGGGTEGLVVQRIDPRTNTIVVGRPAESRIAGLRLIDFVDMAPGMWQPGDSVQIQCRYRQQTQWPGRIVEAGDSAARVVFDEPVANIAPGQWCVGYSGDTVLWGGIIASSYSVSADQLLVESIM
jgi:tRNA-specific 2-thiouridylase